MSGSRGWLPAPVVSPKDRDRFRWLAYTVSGIGLCCTFAFWALVRVPPRNVNSPSLNFVRQPGMWWYCGRRGQVKRRLFNILPKN